MLEHRVEAHGVARFDGVEQGDFDEDFLRRGVAQAGFRVGQHFHDAGERLGGRGGGLFLQPGGFGFGNFQQAKVATRHAEEEQVAEVVQQVRQQPAQVLAVLGEVVQLPQRRLGFAGEDGAGDFENLPLRRQAEHREHVRLLDGIAAKADELVQGGFGVAHPAVRAAGDGEARSGVNFHLLQRRDVLEVLDDERGGDAAEVEALAAGKDRRQHLFGVGGGEEELHVLRRLFEGLEQRVERRRGEHVDFVDDEDFELRRRRHVFDRLAQLADLLDAVVARAVNFQHVHGTALGDLLAARVGVVEVHLRAGGAVEALGEDAGDGGFAGAARAAEQVGVRDAVLRDGVGERLGDVLLADDIREPLRAIFAGDDLVTHVNAEGRMKNEECPNQPGFCFLHSAFFI